MPAVNDLYQMGTQCYLLGLNGSYKVQTSSTILTVRLTEEKRYSEHVRAVSELGHSTGPGTLEAEAGGALRFTKGGGVCYRKKYIRQNCI